MTKVSPGLGLIVVGTAGLPYLALVLTWCLGRIRLRSSAVFPRRSCVFLVLIDVLGLPRLQCGALHVCVAACRADILSTLCLDDDLLRPCYVRAKSSTLSKPGAPDKRADVDTVVAAVQDVCPVRLSKVDGVFLALCLLLEDLKLLADKNLARYTCIRTPFPLPLLLAPVCSPGVVDSPSTARLSSPFPSSHPRPPPLIMPILLPVQPPQPPQKQTSSGSKRKSKAGGGGHKGGGAGSSKGGAKSAKGGGGGRRASGGGGGSRAAPNPAKAAADKAAKAAAKARKNAEEKKRKAEEAAKAAEAAAAAQNPLTFDEKKALSVAINNLDQGNLTRVVEIIQARMPLGSSDEEIELDIDSMDNLTLRDLQSFIKDVSGGAGRRGGGGVDSDSEGEQW